MRGEMRGGKGKADRASRASTRERFFVRWVVVDTPQDFAYLALAMREVMVEEVGEKMEAVVKAPAALPSSPPVWSTSRVVSLSSSLACRAAQTSKVFRSIWQTPAFTAAVADAPSSLFAELVRRAARSVIAPCAGH